MPKLRMMSWNMNQRQEGWDALRAEADLDVALLQEARKPDASLGIQTTPTLDEPWTTAGGKRNFVTAVARFSERVKCTPLVPKRMEDALDHEFRVSRAGSIAAADVQLADGETVTVVSLYSAWERPREGAWIYADASAHRLISDLAYLIHRSRGHRIIAAGDMNIVHGYGEDGDKYFAARYATVFARFAAIGMPFVGPQFPNGRQAEPWPAELPKESLNVPTFRWRRTDPKTAVRQMDFVFASEDLRDRIHVRALNGNDDWGPSDHCRLMIELD